MTRYLVENVITQTKFLLGLSLNLILRGMPPRQPRGLLVDGLFGGVEVAELTQFVTDRRRVSAARSLQHLVNALF
jgi:hypothetical protein